MKEILTDWMTYRETHAIFLYCQVRRYILLHNVLWELEPEKQSSIREFS